MSYTYEIIREKPVTVIDADLGLKYKEKGKIIDVKVNGKPVKRGFIHGLKKAQKTNYWKEYKTDGKAKNPFSGVEIELNPLEWSILTWCQAWYYNDYSQNMNTGKFQAPIQAYDDMKYFLMSLNRKAYYELLD